MSIYYIISNKVWGGGEQYVYDICKNLATEGFSIELFYRPNNNIEHKLLALNLHISKLPLRGGLDLFSAIAIAFRIRNAGRCIIHVQNFNDAFTAVLAQILSSNKKAKIIVTRHLVKKGKNNFIYTWLYKHINRIIFVSAFAKNAFLSSNPNIAHSKLQILHNSIDTQQCAHHTIVNLKEKYNLRTHDIILMFHGRIVEEKGLNILIRALGEVKNPHIHLIIIGYGHCKYISKLKQIAKENGILCNIHFEEFQDDIMPYIQQADIGVLPSVVPESFLLSGLEYMSQGKCLLTTNNGGQTEYITNHSTGILCAPADVKELASIIEYAANNIDECKKIGLHAQEYYQSNLYYHIFINKLISLYQSEI